MTQGSPIANRAERIGPREQPWRSTVTGLDPKRNTYESVLRADASAVTGRSFCEAILLQVSRTFALSIDLLPGNLRAAVRTAYLLCRIVDTIEDEAALDRTVRASLFDAFDLLLANAGVAPEPFERACSKAVGSPGADVELCNGAGAVFRTLRRLPEHQREVIRPPVRKMSRGMREYSFRADNVGSLRLTDLADLERYCYFVAGTVGELLTDLFEQTLPELPNTRRVAIRARAVAFGLGLQ